MLEFALHNGSFVEKRTTFTIYEDKYRIILGFHKLTSISILRGMCPELHQQEPLHQTATHSLKIILQAFLSNKLRRI